MELKVDMPSLAGQDIDPETFDLTELIHDIEKMEENET